MKKYILMITMLLLPFVAKAQFSISSPNYATGSRWIFGGNAGANLLGGSGWGISLSPTVGYKLTNELVGGLSMNLSYQGYKGYKSFIMGAGPFLRYYFARKFYLSANYKYYFVSQKNNYTGSNTTAKEGALNLGAGYLQALGGNVYLHLGAEYNVLYKEETSILSSPFVPYVGIVFGL